MKLVIDTGFQLFPWGFRRLYRGRAPIPAHTLSSVADTVIRSFLPNGALTGAPLVNYKGRDLHTQRLIQADAFPRTLSDELLYVAGSIQLSDGDTAPFFLSITTRFKEFEGSDRIVHIPHCSYSPELPGYVPLEYLARVLPLTITYLRVGFDFFTPRISVALLGVTPTPTERFTLEANTQEIATEIVGEGFRSRDREPLQDLNIISKLSQLVA